MKYELASDKNKKENSVFGFKIGPLGYLIGWFILIPVALVLLIIAIPNFTQWIP